MEENKDSKILIVDDSKSVSKEVVETIKELTKSDIEVLDHEAIKEKAWPGQNTRRSFLSSLLIPYMIYSMDERLDNIYLSNFGGGGIGKQWDGARDSKDYKFDKDGVAEKLIDVGRNELCLCGSGKKYKKCCLNNK